ncbi:hypothetical protein PMZ80_007626 [Knufia obscura]|uniref:Thioredoxin domain-containing protein n=1 Tax=Knufia obscura TaxID=1635080 RepID=A0ABR0RHX0_9EURO|nr:hypothetical protein PMZ80_007626 [Knufia obscura]
MGDARPRSEGLEHIVDEESHNAVVNKKNQAANIPLVIVVTSSTPASKSLLPSVIELLRKDKFQQAGVRWYEMQLTAKTTPMIKFGPQNCPIVVLMRGMYCETLLGIRGAEEVEKKVREMVGR